MSDGGQEVGELTSSKDTAKRSASAGATASGERAVTKDVKLGGRSKRRGGLQDSVVTAKGTGDGVVLRLDGMVPGDLLVRALFDYLDSRQSFLENNNVALEWLGQLPSEEVLTVITERLQKDYSVLVRSSELASRSSSAGAARLQKAREAQQVQAQEAVEEESVIETEETTRKGRGLFGGLREKVGLPSRSTGMSREGLFGGIGSVEEIETRENDIEEDLGVESLSDSGAALVDPSAWDDPDARIVFKTLRSGQRVETEHSLIVVGDVNSGAELVAGGDIIVLGTLRGVAHAGAYDESGGGSFIFGLQLEPSQLRIGSVISRGEAGKARCPEIARVDGTLIVVEPFQARSALSRLRR